MTTISGTFTAAGSSAYMTLAPGETATYDLSGTFTGTVDIQRGLGSEWATEVAGTADTAASGTIKNDTGKTQRYRFHNANVSAGSAVYTMSDAVDTVKEWVDHKGAVVMRSVDGGMEFPGTAAFTGAVDQVAEPTTQFGVGAKNGATVTAAEYGDGVVHKTVLTCVATPLTFGDEAGQGQYGGVKVYDFPPGLIATLGAVVDGNLTLSAPAIDTWEGDIGLGVAAPLDHQDAANLAGQIMPKVAIAAATSKVAAVPAVSVAAALTESGMRWRDGTGTAIDLYFNILVDDNGAHDNTITGLFTGTITFFWVNVGDHA